MRKTNNVNRLQKTVILILLGMLSLICCGIAEAGELFLPDSLTEIQAEAFYGDTALEEVILPEGLKTIRSLAFANSSLQRIYLPQSLTSIASNAFSGCEAVVGYGPAGTAASRFFQDQSRPNLTFEQETLELSSQNWETVSALEGFPRDHLTVTVNGTRSLVEWTLSDHSALDMVVLDQNRAIILPKQTNQTCEATLFAEAGSMTDSMTIRIYSRPEIRMNEQPLSYGSVTLVNPLMTNEDVCLQCISTDSETPAIQITVLDEEPSFAFAETISGTNLSEGSDYTRNGTNLIVPHNTLNTYAGKWLLIKASTHGGLAETSVCLKVYQCNLSITSVDSNAVRLQWDLLPNAVSYDICYNSLLNESGAQSVTIPQDRAGNGFLITGSFNKSTLYYWVYANLADESRVRLGFKTGPAPGSNRVQYLKVTGVTASRTTPYSVVLNWNPPYNSRNIIGHRITYWETGSTDQLKNTMESGEGNYCTIRNLQPGTSYSFKVIARALGGVVGPDSDVYTVTTADTSEMILEKPDNVQFYFTRSYINTGELLLNIAFTPVGPSANYTLYASKTMFREDAFLGAGIGMYTGDDSQYLWTGEYALSAAGYGFDELTTYYFWIEAENDKQSIIAGPFSATAWPEDTDDADTPRVVSVSIPEGSVRTGDEVAMQANTRGATGVSLFIDDQLYGKYTVENDTATIQMSFHKAGNRKISLRAEKPGVSGELRELGFLLVEADGLLDSPEVEISGAMIPQGDVFLRWPAVKNAEKYYVYIYREGKRKGSFIVNAGSGEVESCRIDPSLLKQTGHYSADVIATAPGYSQQSGSVLFTLASQNALTVYLEPETAPLCSDNTLAEPVFLLNRTAELTRLYTDEKAAYIRCVQDGETMTGWVDPEAIRETQPAAETELIARYLRTNKTDINCNVTITITGSNNIKKVRILKGNQLVAEETDSNPVNGKPESVQFRSVIPAVTVKTTFTIQALDSRDAVIKDTTLTVDIPSGTTTGLGTPELGECAPVPSGTNTEISWAPVTGAETYLFTLKKDGVEMCSPMTIAGTASKHLISGDLLEETGEYIMTLQARKTSGGKTVTGGTASMSIQVTENTGAWYLSGNASFTPEGKYGWGMLTWMEPFQVTDITAHDCTITFVDRTGKSVKWEHVSQEGLSKSRQKRRPSEAASFWLNGILSGDKDRCTSTVIPARTESEGKDTYLWISTNAATAAAELTVDGETITEFTPKRLTGSNIDWQAVYTVTAGTHTVKAVLIGPDGSRTESKPMTLTATHRHQPRAGSAVIGSPVIITEQGIAYTSAICEQCGASIGAGVASPAVVYPDSIQAAGNQITVTGNLNSDTMQIQGNISLKVNTGITLKVQSISIDGTIELLQGAKLQCNSISCGKLIIGGTVDCPNISANEICVDYSGVLKMNADTDISVGKMIFAAGNNHSGYMTGGILTVSGDMEIRTPFQPAASHRTVFTNGRHTLLNRGNTYFGILVLQCPLGSFGSQYNYRYRNAVFLNESTSNYQVAPVSKELPDNLKPYESALKARNSSSIEADLRKKEYSKYSGVHFNLQYQGNCFTVTTNSSDDMLPQSKYLLKVENAGVNALSEYAENNKKNDIISRILGVISFKDYYDGGVYPYKGDTMHFSARIDAIGAGNAGGQTAVMTVQYTEWLESAPERKYTGNFTLVPTMSLNKRTIASMMETMQWEGKKYADETIKEQTTEIMLEYGSIVTGWETTEELGQCYSKIVTVLEVGRQAMAGNAPSDPLLTVYTDQGMMSVSQEYGNFLLSDATNMTYRHTLETILE